MEQKFVKFEEAHEKLGISAEQLTRLRESGELRAYRDGASWKFRADEIQKFVEEGIPEPAPPSDIGLAAPDELIAAEPIEIPVDDEELSLADDDLSLSAEDSGVDIAEVGGSELDLGELEDTVTAGASDISLDLDDEGSDPSDSILLSEEELGESALNPPSTIIGKTDIAAQSADLDLTLAEDDEPESDVRLAGGASDVLSSGVAGSGVLDDEGSGSGGGSAFEGLEELELDLAAESGSVVGVGKGEDAQQAEVKQGESDLEITDDEGTDPVPSDIGLAAGSSAAGGPTSDLDLATDEDDFVLAEAGGSDITLDSSDSGINLDPSDSGLALDGISLDVGGSAILSSLSLESDDDDQDISLVSDDDAAELQTDDDFDLTPMSAADDEDGDSSSQVIALDADLEGLDSEEGGILDETAFAEASEDDAVVLSEEYGETGAGLDVAAYPTATRTDSEYSLMNIIGLGCCALMLLIGMVVMLDMARNIWSWNETFALNSWLLDSVLGLFGM